MWNLKSTVVLAQMDAFELLVKIFEWSIVNLKSNDAVALSLCARVSMAIHTARANAPILSARAPVPSAFRTLNSLCFCIAFEIYESETKYANNRDAGRNGWLVMFTERSL